MAIAKLPHRILPNLYRFAPNRDTLGGTAYLLTTGEGNVLIDCPAWHGEIEEWLKQRGQVRWLCLTHRDGHGPKVKTIQEKLGCQVVVQEQEAYLLPGVKICRFREQLAIAPSFTAIWTPGYSPGASCYYWGENDGILFTGRHLLPNGEGHLRAIRQTKTFHWPRQQASVEKFIAIWMTTICP
ncbi:MBL fold metallo-hydrolase [Synechocystis salina]|uniref:MBL fold metallo-hydrolase n=1 Tax=Synechocystis salina TaxID=945780 RepID=UPI001D142B5B|nr:MBL fold metallo-hydrolase [Synechocystis salina]